MFLKLPLKLIQIVRFFSLSFSLYDIASNMHNILRDRVSTRVYGNSIFASRIALHLSPQVPIEILGNRT